MNKRIHRVYDIDFWFESYFNVHIYIYRLYENVRLHSQKLENLVTSRPVLVRIYVILGFGGTSCRVSEVSSFGRNYFQHDILNKFWQVAEVILYQIFLQLETL